VTAADGERIDRLVAPLGAPERGFLLGALLLGQGPALAGALAEPSRGRCAPVMAALAGLSRAERAAVSARLAPELTASFPPRLAEVHPSWLREALAAEPSEIFPALLAGAPPAVRAAAAEVLGARGEPRLSPSPAALAPEACAELQRLVFGGLAPALERPGPAWLEALCALGPEALLEEVLRRGAATLGASLAGTPLEARARAMAGVGPRWARVLEAAAAGEGGARAEAQADVAGAATERADTAAERLEQIGLRALARALAPEGPAAVQAVAMRLPARMGRRLQALAEAQPAGEGR
jgi:hypothetical protein